MNLRGMDEGLERRAKAAAIAEGKSLREWVEGAILGVLEGDSDTSDTVHVTEVARYSDGEIREALAEHEAAPEVGAREIEVFTPESPELETDTGSVQPTKEEIRDELREMIRKMEGKESGNGSSGIEGDGVPELTHAPAFEPRKRRICPYDEFDQESGETYRCGLEAGHKGRHTKGAKMEGEPRKRACKEHGDRWCTECG